MTDTIGIVVDETFENGRRIYGPVDVAKAARIYGPFQTTTNADSYAQFVSGESSNLQKFSPSSIGSNGM